MFLGYVNNLQSHYHCQVRKQVQKAAFVGHPLIGMSQLQSCPVLTLNVHWSGILFPGQMIQPFESHMQTEMDGTDSIALSTGDACYTIQLLSHMLSPPYFPLQIPCYELLSLLEQQLISDYTSGGQWFVRLKYLPVVVHVEHFLLVSHSVTRALMAILLHLLKSIHDGSARSQHVSRNILLGNSASYIDIGYYCS